MFKIIRHYGNANQNQLLPIKTDKIKKMIKSVGADVEIFEPSRIAGGYVKCWSCFGKFFVVIQF